MKIEELHEILKKNYKKYVSQIEEDPSYLGFGSSYKQFYITKKDLTINILQVDKKLILKYLKNLFSFIFKNGVYKNLIFCYILNVNREVKHYG